MGQALSYKGKIGGGARISITRKFVVDTRSTQQLSILFYIYETKTNIAIQSYKYVRVLN